MRQRLSVLAFALAAGCIPQTATVSEGEFTAFLSVQNSQTLFNKRIDLDGVAAAGGTLSAVDCRDADDFDVLAGGQEFCGAIEDFEYETWLEQDGFHVVNLPLEPWRGEAIVTSEGDLQVTFHNRLPGGADFRFAVSVNPTFQPMECAVNDAGDGELVPVDGDWLGAWAADLATWDPPQSGSLFYINASDSQQNPSNADEYWEMPERWAAGFATAKFAEEDFALVPATMLYVGADEGADPTTDDAYQAAIDEANDISTAVDTELGTVFGAGKVDTKVHTNTWRTPDDAQSGLDNWVGVHRNWIRFDQPASDLTVGNTASGELHLLMTSDGTSYLWVRAAFDIGKIKQDKWTLDDLTAEKLEEYGTELCGGVTTFE